MNVIYETVSGIHLKTLAIIGNIGVVSRPLRECGVD